MERSEPPIIAPVESKGDEGPKSIVKPVFLPELFQTIVVPAATQKVALDFAPGRLGVVEAEEEVRFTSISHG